MEAFASASAPPVGTGTPYTCTRVPNAVAQATGTLHAREDFVGGNAGVIYQGMTRGSVATSKAGPVWTSVGVNVKSRGGKLTAVAILDGLDFGVACLEIGILGYPPDVTKCGMNPQASLDTIPATYAIEVKYHPPAKTRFDTNPCPNSGFVTCTVGASWESGAGDVVVKQIAYTL